MNIMPVPMTLETIKSNRSELTNKCISTKLMNNPIPLAKIGRAHV